MKNFGRWIFNRRPGVGLPLALLIVLVGAGLVTMMVGMSQLFARDSVRQREMYIDHLQLVGYMEKAKGTLAELMRVRGRPLHPDNWYIGSNPSNELRIGEDLNIESMQELEINLAHLADIVRSADISGGAQTIVTRIYDMAYHPDDLDEEIFSNPHHEDLPASMLQMAISGGAGNIESEDDGVREGDPSVWAGGEKFTIDPWDIRQMFGAYVVQVALFDKLPNGNWAATPTKMLEEAFFQLEF